MNHMRICKSNGRRGFLLALGLLQLAGGGLYAHLVMAYDDAICPIAEFPMTEDIPKQFLDGPYLLAPDWPGIYCIDSLERPSR